MAIAIKEFSAHNRHDLNRCDAGFTVDSILLLHVESDIPTYTIVSIPPYRKHYPRSQIDLEEYIAQLEKGIFFAYSDGLLAGQIILHKNWNGFAYIDEIAVDVAFRRHGIGRALIQHAIV